jgi:choline-sulfatase
VRGEPTPSPVSRGPNILILVADDHRGGTLGIDGDSRQATPHLDALARQGVRFSRAFCNAPLCTASRQSFITGRLPHAVGVNRLATPLPATAVTLADWLGPLGYDTAAFGKMHFNSEAHHGFSDRLDLREWEHWLRVHHPKGGDHRRPWRPFKDPARVWLNTQCESVGLPAASMNSTFLADKAIDYLRTHRDRPFLLVVGFHEPHAPFEFPREWSGRYRPRDFPRPTVTEADLLEQPRVFHGLTGGDAQGIQAAYYTSLSFLDEQVGRIVEAVDRNGLAGNTVIVYLGDNGYLLGEHARFEKHCLFDPAVHVPLVVRWPGQVPAGRRVDAMVELVDLMPGLLDLAGIAPPPDLQGMSLAPLLRGDPRARGRDVVFSEYLANEEAMVRSDRYKLVVGNGRVNRDDGYENGRPVTGPYERLYDLQADPGENRDLAAVPEFRQVKASLRKHLTARLVATRDPREGTPTFRSENEAIRWCLIPHDRMTTGAR